MPVTLAILAPIHILHQIRNLHVHRVHAAWHDPPLPYKQCDRLDEWIENNTTSCSSTHSHSQRLNESPAHFSHLRHQRMALCFKPSRMSMHATKSIPSAANLFSILSIGPRGSAPIARMRLSSLIPTRCRESAKEEGSPISSRNRTTGSREGRVATGGWSGGVRFVLSSLSCSILSTGSGAGGMDTPCCCTGLGSYDPVC